MRSVKMWMALLVLLVIAGITAMKTRGPTTDQSSISAANASANSIDDQSTANATTNLATSGITEIDQGNTGNNQGHYLATTPTNMERSSENAVTNDYGAEETSTWNQTPTMVNFESVGGAATGKEYAMSTENASVAIRSTPSMRSTEESIAELRGQGTASTPEVVATTNDDAAKIAANRADNGHMNETIPARQ